MVVSPMVRLTNKANASIEEIGPPEKIISALGPFVTGNSFDPDEVLETSVEKKGDLTVSSPMISRLAVVYLYRYLNRNVSLLFEDD